MQKWEERYIELMFGPNSTRETMENAAKIKFEHMPRRFYKYREFNDYHKKALEESVLYCSPPSTFNDIRDTNLVLTDAAIAKIIQKAYDHAREEYGLPEATVANIGDVIRIADTFLGQKAEVPKYMVEIMRKHLESLADTQSAEIKARYRNESRDTYNVCSFSASYDIQLMWAHYSKSYTGFCIEYDFKSLGLTADDVQLMFPVLYRPDARIFINDIENIDQSRIMYGATVKNEEWSYEQEWRRLYHGGKSASQRMPKPTAIYLGERAKDQDIEWMRQFCLDRSIQLYRMVYNEATNNLVPEPA